MAGSFVIRGEQDGFGNHVSQLYDLSGTGAGPFLPVVLVSDGAGGVLSGTGGGGGGGTVTQGAPGTQPWLVSWSGQSVSVSNFPATQPISGTVTANLGTLNGAALDTSVQQVKTTLGTPFQAGGSIANTAFGISGTLPAFATTPTFNIGTAPTITVQGTATVTQGPAGASAWKVDGSAVTQPISAAALPLPAGAATSANQNSTAAGTSASNAQAVQGVTNGVQLSVVQNGSTSQSGVGSAGLLNASGATFKGSPGNAYAVNVIAGATAGFAILIDASAVPSSGAAITPKWSMPIAVNGGFSGSPMGNSIGMGFPTGVTLLFSSALATYTPVTAAFLGASVK